MEHYPPNNLGFVGYLRLPLLGLGHHQRLHDFRGRWDTATLWHLWEKGRDEGHRVTMLGIPTPTLGTPSLPNAAISL